MEDWDYRDKVAVVTGGGSGIGYGLVRRLAARGALVVVADIDPSAAEVAAAETGGFAVQVDVGAADSVQALADTCLDRYGRVDVVCNNAGVGPLAAVRDMTLDDWRWMLEVNLWGVVHGLHSFLPLLERNRTGGRLLSTASVAALAPPPNMAAYAAAKAAVLVLTEVLAAELDATASGVRATVLCPGPVRTRIAESQRHRPGHSDRALRDTDLSGRIAAMGLSELDPEDAAEIAVRALARGDRYVFTHPEWSSGILGRNEEIASCLVRPETAVGQERPAGPR